MRAAEFVAKWQTRQAELERLHAQVDGATVCRELLQDFERFRAGEAEELLNLCDAARLSGYSEDHLGKLVRAGKIPNAGRAGSPRIRRADLPRRPTRVAPKAGQFYDPDADARSLAIRRKEMAS